MIGILEYWNNGKLELRNVGTAEELKSCGIPGR
jgi:hypothetical protein